MQVCRILYDDVVSSKEAEKISGMKLRRVGQLVDEGKLTLPV